VPVLLVRHARAGNRNRWNGDDRLRPLTERGRQQAAALVGALDEVVRASRRPVEVVSSPWVRCVETVTPLAQALGADIVTNDDLGEGRGPAAIKLVMSLAETTAVLCTHGDVVGEVLDALHHQGVDLGRSPVWPKASAWVLQARGGVFRSARYIPPPA
jgi:8-oxo-dGTP diphosphatase